MPDTTTVKAKAGITESTEAATSITSWISKWTGGRRQKRKKNKRSLQNVLAIGEKEIWQMTIEEIIEEEEHLHGHMDEEFIVISKNLDLILDISSITFIFPLMLIGRFTGAYKTRRVFKLTVSDYFDLLLFGLTVWAWIVVENFRNTPLTQPLFGPEKDTVRSIQFLTNVMDNSMADTFHLDYLMAAITALLWYRANLQLRLTETFGPLLVMIYSMVKLVIVFLFVYLLGLLTFACVATLTLTSNENFSNLFRAMRTYFDASLG